MGQEQSRAEQESDLYVAVVIRLKLDFCKNFSWSLNLAGHHDSAITLPNRFLVCNLRHDIFGSCRKIQFCCNISPHLGLSFLPNHQIINLFSPSLADKNPHTTSGVQTETSYQSETSHQTETSHHTLTSQPHTRQRIHIRQRPYIRQRPRIRQIPHIWQRPHTRPSLNTLSLFACLDHLKGFCLQKVFSLPDWRHKKFHPIIGCLTELVFITVTR